MSTTKEPVTTTETSTQQENPHRQQQIQEQQSSLSQQETQPQQRQQQRSNAAGGNQIPTDSELEQQQQQGNNTEAQTNNNLVEGYPIVPKGQQQEEFPVNPRPPLHMQQQTQAPKPKVDHTQTDATIQGLLVQVIALQHNKIQQIASQEQQQQQ